ncbi:MAG: EMC3/TMCO1 family protein [Candidatus Bathyarchaeota archaeon]|nr:EMC3/TMCO1 family protein [Candidatus Bathyarchaeota archaeon]
MDISTIPLATVVIMLISMGVSFLSMGINRLLISRMVGWDEYRSIQQEVKEYRSQMMQATRNNDKKTLEKLKRKEAQINRMQMKISKPSFVLIPISFSYILIWWFFLTPVYGMNPVAYIPGIAPTGIPVLYWYMLCSFLFSTLAGRIMGTNPLQ